MRRNITTLRRSGRSIVVTLPNACLDQLGLTVGTPVDIGVVGNKIVITRRSPGRIGLDARLAMCKFNEPMTTDERDWLDVPAFGDEAI